MGSQSIQRPAQGHRIESAEIPGIVGRSAGILSAVELATRFAPTEIPILLIGETGTGKEVLARYIHRMSRKKGPLVDVDCGSLPETLTEATLFGHRKGAFTGAHLDSEGLIERAHGGTLFLDELASLAPAGQATLLRVVESGEVRRIGSHLKRTVEFRLIAAVREDLESRLREGLVRVDLIQRLAGAVIRLPPLAERPEDVVPLARHFAVRAGGILDPSAEHPLTERTWVGNVRELRWTVERAVILSGDGRVTSDVLTEAFDLGAALVVGDRHSGGDGNGANRTRLRALCAAHGGDADAIASDLGVARSTVYRRLKEVGLSLQTFRHVPVG